MNYKLKRCKMTEKLNDRSRPTKRVSHLRMNSMSSFSRSEETCNKRRLSLTLSRRLASLSYPNWKMSSRHREMNKISWFRITPPRSMTWRRRWTAWPSMSNRLSQRRIWRYQDMKMKYTKWNKTSNKLITNSINSKSRMNSLNQVQMHTNNIKNFSSFRTRWK